MSSDPRTETLRFRCTPREVEDFERAASADARTVSDWLRFVATRASQNGGPSEAPVASPGVLPKGGTAPRNPPAAPKAVSRPPKPPASSGGGSGGHVHTWVSYTDAGVARCSGCKEIKR